MFFSRASGWDWQVIVEGADFCLSKGVEGEEVRKVEGSVCTGRSVRTPGNSNGGSKCRSNHEDREEMSHKNNVGALQEAP